MSWAFVLTAARRAAAAAVAVAAVAAGAADARGQVFYVTNGGSGVVSRISAAGTVTPFVTGLSNPSSLTRDGLGNLYVTTGTSTYTVTKVTPAAATSVYANMGSGAANALTGGAFDSENTLFVARGGATTGNIVAVDAAGTVTPFVTGTGVSSPRGLAFDAAGNLYVANVGTNAVLRITSGGAVNTFATGFTGPSGLAFDAGGNLYVSNANAGSVSKVTPGGVVSAFATGFSAPFGLTFDNTGFLYVTNVSGGSVSKVSPAGVVTPFATGLTTPNGIVFDPTPVPEPGTFALGGMAAAGLAASRRRRRWRRSAANA